MSPPEDHIRTGGRRAGVATINRDGFSGGTGKASFRAERSYCVEWIGSWIVVRCTTIQQNNQTDSMIPNFGAYARLKGNDAL